MQKICVYCDKHKKCDNNNDHDDDGNNDGVYFV